MADYWLLLPVLTLLGGFCALAPLGVQVLKRGVVFIDLAVAQSAAAATLWMGVIHHSHAPWILMPTSIAGALCCAWAVAVLCKRWPARREALIGLLYIVGAMLALLAAQFNPHGKEDLQHLLAADLLWSDGTDLAAALGCGALVLWITAKGKKWLSHDGFFYALFAVVASVLVQSLGVFLVFALLIAPAILFMRSGLPRAAGLIALAILMGFSGSWAFDLPSGICLTLAVAGSGLGCVFGRHRQDA
jgi:zinc/manganese transport system permease protein